MTKKINPKDKGYEFKNNVIISEMTINSNGFKILAKEFGEQNLFLNFDIKSNKKIPFIPCSYRPADYTNPEHYRTLKQAIQSIEKYNRAGVGIALADTLQGHLCGLDIDGCIDENGNICREALEIVKLFDSYAEISISGTGIHILFYANKKDSCTYNKKLKWCKSIELYNKKFFTVSGKCINNKRVKHRQNACNAIIKKYFNVSNNENILLFKNNNYTPFDENFLQSLLKKDEKLRYYWNREMKIDNESDSDFGFLAKLKQYLKNPTSIKEYFLASPYFMRKDDFHKQKALGMDRKSNKKYLDISIENLFKESISGGQNG